jgi:branched-chain amino acid transport system substrate-binding protein
MPQHRKSYRLPALSTLILAACLANPPAFAQACEIKIGVAGPMAGGAASWGLAIKAGAEFIAAQTNAAGGLVLRDRKCKVAVVSFDSQYTAAGGAAAANYFAGQNIKVIIGPLGAPEATGMRPVAHRNGQLTFTSALAKDAIAPQFPLAFHQLTGPAVWGHKIVKAAKERFNFSSAVIVGPNDQGGTDGATVMAKAYEINGVKAAIEYFQRGTTNFAPLVTRIMNKKPDTVDLATVPPGDTATITKQLVEAGYEGFIGRSGGSGSTEIIRAAGGVEKIKGFYWLELVPLDDPKVRTLRADYEAVMKNPVPENTIVYTSATATYLALKAIAAASTDSDAEKVAVALRKLVPETPYLGKGAWRGKTEFGINQELAFPVGMGIIANGKSFGISKVEIDGE